MLDGHSHARIEAGAVTIVRLQPSSRMPARGASILPGPVKDSSGLQQYDLTLAPNIRFGPAAFLQLGADGPKEHICPTHFYVGVTAFSY